MTDDRLHYARDLHASRDLHETYDPSDLPPGASFAGADSFAEPGRAQSGQGSADTAGDDAAAYAADYRRRYARDYAAEAAGRRPVHRDADRSSGATTALLLGVAGAATYLTARLLTRRARHFDFAGRVALVTGGSRGLGLELARQLVDAGARVAICARDDEALERARRELAERAERRGGSAADVFARTCDVTDQGDVERFVGRVRAALGDVDVLINNAGVIQVGPTEQMRLEDYEEAMRTNFYGPLYFALTVAPGMVERRRGRIVNVSSIGGKFAVPHLVPYSASKFALTGLSEGLRISLAKHDVYVTTVCPGELRTGSTVHAVFKGDAEEEFRWFASGSSAPVASMSAERAATRILRACQGGDAELVLPVPSLLQVRFHGLFPGIFADLTGKMDARLPAPAPGGEERHAGHEVADRAPGWAKKVQGELVREFNQGEAFAP